MTIISLLRYCVCSSVRVMNILSLGAFLIPYLLFHAACGIPMLFMEVSLGQFTRHSSVGSWDIVPMLKVD